MATILRRAVAAVAFLLLAGPALAGEQFLGVWVTRWDYRTAGDVRQCVERCASLGATDIFWQVRGQADAFYASDLEPWGRELFRDLPEGATSPGFDPLEAAVGAAHERGLRLHAWVNVMPLWKGKTPPKDPKHPYNAHPEWRLMDSVGAPQQLTEHYVIINPLCAAAQDHVVAVCKDILTRYAVDGLHMDYIRFVSDSMSDPAKYPGDPESVKAFEAASGRAWKDTEEDRAAFRAFKRDRITALVKRIRAEALPARPGAVLTAAVWRRPDLARETYLQDAAEWLRDGTLDRACPMIYTKDDKQFADDLAAWMSAAPDRPVSPGIGIYLHAPGATASQLGIAEADRTAGVALFAYSAVFESVDPNQDKGAARVAERAERLRLLRGEPERPAGGRRPAAAPAANDGP